MSTAIQDARVFVGRVIGTAMFKTIKVKVFRKFLNPKTETVSAITSYHIRFPFLPL